MNSGMVETPDFRCSLRRNVFLADMAVAAAAAGT